MAEVYECVIESISGAGSATNIFKNSAKETNTSADA